jgi:uncharacterized protein YdhG (YjbR/CyaY superfamily)
MTAVITEKNAPLWKCPKCGREFEKKISWRMPTFWQGENLIHFAVFKRHIGVYPGSEAMTHFANRLEGYKTSKGSIQFPLDSPIDHGLITSIVRWRVSQADGRE